MGESSNSKRANFTFPLILFYLFILTLNFCWNGLLWVFSKSACSGTGMGANSGTVMCQDYTDLALPLFFALSLLLVAGAVHVIRIHHLGWLSAGVIIVCTIIVIFAMPTLVWSYALSTLSVR